MCWLTPQIATTHGAEAGQRQDLPRVQGPEDVGDTAALPDVLAGIRTAEQPGLRPAPKRDASVLVAV